MCDKNETENNWWYYEALEWVSERKKVLVEVEGREWERKSDMGNFYELDWL